MLQVSVVVGNPKAASRTLMVAQAAVRSLLLPGSFDVRTFDLAGYAGAIFEWPCPEMAFISDYVAASDVAVFASPTYKATYTGLLKGFLDRYPAGGLRGVIAIPVMTGADLSHSVAPDAHLRPLLVELGASVPTSALYFVTSQMDRMDGVVAEWANGNRRVFRTLARIADAVETTPWPAERPGARHAAGNTNSLSSLPERGSSNERDGLGARRVVPRRDVQSLHACLHCDDDR